MLCKGPTYPLIDSRRPCFHPGVVLSRSDKECWIECFAIWWFSKRDEATAWNDSCHSVTLRLRGGLEILKVNHR